MKSIEINVGGKTRTFYRYPQFFTFGLGFGAIVYFLIGILYFIDREWELAFYDALVANMCLVLCHFYVKNNQLFDYVNDLYARFDRLNKLFIESSTKFQAVSELSQSRHQCNIGSVLVPYGQKISTFTIPMPIFKHGVLIPIEQNEPTIQSESVVEECTATAKKVELYFESACEIIDETDFIVRRLALDLIKGGVIKIVPVNDIEMDPHLKKYAVYLKYMVFDK